MIKKNTKRENPTPQKTTEDEIENNTLNYFQPTQNILPIKDKESENELKTKISSSNLKKENYKEKEITVEEKEPLRKLYVDLQDGSNFKQPK
ncbi:MAG: hypothetical protein MJ252_05670 [archaeon]|nr:hypothetical protein [archaeon]